MSDLAPPTEQAKIVRICDIETSGLPEDEQHAICEMGWVDLRLDDMTFRDPTTFMVNPGHPIPPHVRAIHHISDRDVAGAMLPDQAVALLTKGLGPEDVLCAHRADFEKAFIPRAGRWVCTLKAAYLAWPELHSHSNQSIRYALDVDSEPDFDPTSAMPPHRALPDAVVTGFILRRLLQMRPLSRLVEIETQPGFLPRFRFGKHVGKTFKEVAASDPSYLEWICNKSDLDADVKWTAKWHLDRRAA